MTRQKGKRFPISGWIGSVLFGGLSLLNFGLAILLIRFGSEGGPESNPTEIFGLAILCFMFAIPFGVISLASIRLLRRGANKLSGITYLITAVFLSMITLFMLVIGLQVLADVDAETSSSFEATIYSLVSVSPFIMSLATTLWIAILSIRVLRSKSIKAISPETFD